MKESRRDFVRKTTGAAVAAGILTSVSSSLGAEETEKSKKPKVVVGACGVSCTACPLMKAKKCKGCGPAHKASMEMVKMKQCKALSCAAMKKIAYCGTDCKMFASCEKLIGRPYAKEFLERIKTRLD